MKIVSLLNRNGEQVTPKTHINSVFNASNVSLGSILSFSSSGINVTGSVTASGFNGNLNGTASNASKTTGTLTIKTSSTDSYTFNGSQNVTISLAGGGGGGGATYKIIHQHFTSSSMTINGYSADYDQVSLYKNGLLLVPTTDYTIGSTGNITLTSSSTFASGDIFDAVIFRVVGDPPVGLADYMTVGECQTQIDSALSNISQLALTGNIASTSTTTGTLRVTGGVGVTGNLYANQVYGAVWNDLADAIEVKNNIELESGRCYLLKKGKCYLSMSDDIGIPVIHSDTFGFLMGNKENIKCIHAAVSGFVLAYVDNEYESGIPLTYSDNGTLTRWSKGKVVVGYYYMKEPNEKWYNREVKGRHWIKVK